MVDPSRRRAKWLSINHLNHKQSENVLLGHLAYVAGVEEEDERKGKGEKGTGDWGALSRHFPLSPPHLRLPPRLFMLDSIMLVTLAFYAVLAMLIFLSKNA